VIENKGKKAYFEAIGYEPHKRQLLYHNDKHRFKAISCGRRFGKTTMVARDAEPSLFLPNKRIWIVGPTYELGEKEFRVIWNDLIIGKKLGKDKRIKKRYNKQGGDMSLEFPWGTVLEVKSADHQDSLVGDNLNHVIMAEAAKHRPETFEKYIRPALADHRGTADFATTPEGQNWFYDLWKLGQNPNEDDYISYRFPSWENPYLYPEGREDPEILDMERNMTPEFFEQEIAADFTAFVGKIYGEFQEDVHVRDLKALNASFNSFGYNPRWPNYVAFDFGFVNPLAAIEFQVSPSEDIYIWREHYKSYLTLEEHINILKARAQPDDYSIKLAFGDAADPEAVRTINQKYTGCMADPDSKTNWREGIDIVKKFLKLYPVGEDEYGTPIEEPKLFIDHSCTNVIREFNNYTVAPTRSKITGPPEKAKKIDDHALDALRYAFVHLFILGASRPLSDAMPELKGNYDFENEYTLLNSGARNDSIGLLNSERITLNVTESGLLTMSQEF